MAHKTQSSNFGCEGREHAGYGILCFLQVNERQEQGAKRINARDMKGMEHFANHWEEGETNEVVGTCIV